MKNINKVISKLENDIKEMFSIEKSGHDIYHLRRTLNLALTIQKKEGGDKLVIAIASFLHDIHRIIEKETKKYCSPKQSLEKVRELLDKLSLSKEQDEKILHCIEFHEEYSFSREGKTVNDIETLVIQDADNLDAIGAIGIARAFSVGGTYNRNMWIPEIPFIEQKYNEEDMDDPSTMHHFHRKLFKLKDNMNTTTAKKIAEKRDKFMHKFVQEFFDEWNGKK
jgi:uncharacterized protein